MNNTEKGCNVYRLWIIPAGVNPLTGRPQYRVRNYQNLGFVNSKFFVTSSLTFPFNNCIIIDSPRKYKRGCIVNPTKILKDRIASVVEDTTPKVRYWSEC